MKRFLPLIALLAVALAAGCVGQSVQYRDGQNPTRSNVSGLNDATENARIEVNATELNATVAAPNATNLAAKFDYFDYMPTTACTWKQPVQVVTGEEEVVVCDKISHPMDFVYPIVYSPMPYYIFNRTSILDNRYSLSLSDIRLAFSEWMNATRGRVKFYEVNETPTYGITVELVPISGLGAGTKAGEASVRYHPFDNYTLIVGANIILDPNPIQHIDLDTTLHEIGHVMGLSHSRNDSSDVMWPYQTASAKTITAGTVESFDVLYKDIQPYE